MSERYCPKTVETTAQAYWDQHQSFVATEDPNKEKFYCLSMLPYPSGHLHMGHVRNYTLSDVMTRYQKMLGKNVLHPIGWDAFGLPAENAAIKHKTAPAAWTYSNIEHIKAQFKTLGLGFDWNRELATCTPEYYHWEQWLFVQLYNKGLVYRKDSVVNWDPVDQTVLANEQVINGRGWRSNALVEKKSIPQWFIKITDYADELLADLDQLEGWPEQVKTMQRNWIGRSEGLQITFDVEGNTTPLAVFTTRPDTLFGVTYLAISAEHPLAKQAAEHSSDIADFIDSCKKTSTIEADLATMEKRGIATGFHAIHPITGKPMPIWIANFVLMEYGTGAVMSVPAHDQRDYEFAHQYDLPLAIVIHPEGADDVDIEQEAYNERGILVNSSEFDGLTSAEACKAIGDILVQQHVAERQVNYRLRDWGVSRQRYWGAPIPMINCQDCGTVPVPEADLPVVLPEDVIVDGEGSPLARMESFYQVACPECGKAAKRETDTFDTFMESSWYFARYCCPDAGSMLDNRADYWLPVNQYIGGIEHAVMHLLYARFYFKLMRDMGLVKADEPFKQLLTQGMVLKDGAKMSKSKGNTVDPQPLIDEYGADTVRLFSMFAAPPEQSLEWSDSGVEGAHRFIKKLWQFAQVVEQAKQRANPIQDPKTQEARSQCHQLLQQANRDFAKYQFNTVVSAGMKMLNLLTKLEENADNQALQYEGLSILLRLLNPIIPHACHHLWQAVGFGQDIGTAAWPKADEQALQSQRTTVMVQVNGKVRGKVQVAPDSEQAEVETLAFADAGVSRHTNGMQIRKIIYVRNRLLNIVVGAPA